MVLTLAFILKNFSLLAIVIFMAHWHFPALRKSITLALIFNEAWHLLGSPCQETIVVDDLHLILLYNKFLGIYLNYK